MPDLPDDAEPELDPRERAALDDWPAPQVASVRPPRRRGRLAALAAIGLATVAATAWIVSDVPAPAPQAGARSVAARESITLGRRGVAVAEAGAALAWQVGSDGAARVDQTAGDVFYRVEPGGPFVVATPAGDVRVTGTCFRVEIEMKPWTRDVASAALGAAVVVTVYEGGVVVVGAGGTEQRAAAGEQLTIGGEGGGAGRGSRRELDDGRPFFDPSPERLLELAARCEVRYDTPAVDGSLPAQISADEAGAEALSPSALAREIEDKSAPGEAERARTRIARERAGLDPVPADLSQTPPIERYLRGIAGLGDEMERMLAAARGPARARALRGAGAGWGNQSVHAGCGDER